MKKYIFLIVACCLVVGTMVYGIVINNQNKVNSDLSMTNQTLIEKIDTAMENYQNLKMEYDTLLLSYNQEKNDHVSDIQKANEQLSNLNQQKLELTLKNNELNEKVKTLDATIADQKTQIEDLQNQIKTNNAKISELESEISSLQAEIEIMQSEISLTEEKFNSLYNSEMAFNYSNSELFANSENEILEYVKVLNKDNELWQKTYSGEKTAITAEDLAGITEIQPYAFYGTKIKSIELPDTIMHVGKYAFANSTLDTIKFSGDGWSTLPDETVSWSELNSHYSIFEKGCFQSTALTSITLPARFSVRSVTYNEEEALYSYLDVGTYLFSNCQSLTKVTFNRAEMYIPEGMFYGCEKLTEIKFVDSQHLTGLDKFAFFGCKSLTQFDYSNQITTLGAYCFAYSGLISYNYERPINFSGLGTKAFYACANLQEINLMPNDPFWVANSLFAYCGKVEKIKINGHLGSGCLKGCYSIKLFDTTTENIMNWFSNDISSKSLKTVILRNENFKVDNIKGWNARWLLDSGVEEIYVADSLFDAFVSNAFLSENFDTAKLIKPLSQYVEPDLSVIA